jgi:CubicO group peptidase (beta-lactamase class C family)
MILRLYDKASICLALAGCLFSFFAGATPCEILPEIYDRADESNSEAVLVVRAGKLLGCYGDAKQYEPIESYSVTKSFVSLAVGILIQERKLFIDAPVYSFYPEWNQGIKKGVTIRHLLSHTSGLQDEHDTFFYQFPDIVQMALVSDFSYYPGTRFNYNNKAANLLAGIVEKVSGMTLQQFLKCRLFTPLGISSDTWLCDEAGHNYGMAHLTINAMDMAKIGMLISSRGCWGVNRLISEEWIDLLETPSQSLNPFYSFLWWLGYGYLEIYWDSQLLEYYAQEGLPSNYIWCLEALQGQVIPLEGYTSYGNFFEKCAGHLLPYFGSYDQIFSFFRQLEYKGLPLARWQSGKVKSIAARGYAGQQLIIFPEESLVGTRMSRIYTDFEGNVDTFRDLEMMLASMAFQMWYPHEVCQNDSVQDECDCRNQ